MSGNEIFVKSAALAYRILIEDGSLDNLGRSMRLLFPADTTLLLSDSKVFSLYGDKAVKSLRKELWQVETFVIKPGERSKTLTTASRIYDTAVETGLDRNTPIIALGGGVVGDLAGFAAATFLRGVPLVMVPTSLLAQVDSSVGGKVAVNHPRGKNLIGTIYPPRLVLVDPSVLETLPGRQLRAGLVEMIKYGIIENSLFFEQLEENIDQLLIGDRFLLAGAVENSLRSKIRVVEADEHEKDYRRILNFGHTVGHALEAATGYRHYLHGEAVLAGIQAAVMIALELGLLDSASAGRINSLVAKIRPKKPPAGLTAAKVIDKLRQDKKRRGSDIVFVLPTAIGSATMVPVNDEQLIKKAVESCLRQ